MKTVAAVVRAPGAPFQLEEVTLREPGPREVVVGMAGVGICHTDLAVRAGKLYETPFPIVLGHEGAGTVERVGVDVTAVKPGDQVLLSFQFCGLCEQCIAGRVAYCVRTLKLNYGSGAEKADLHGVLADGTPVYTGFFGQSSLAHHAVVGESSVVHVDAGADLKWLGPLGCSVQAGAGAVINVAHPRPGDSVVVFGVGAVGLGAVIASKLAGCFPVIAVDRDPQRLSRAVEFGADVAVTAEGPGVVKEVRKATGGGATFSFECTGVPAVLPEAVRVLDRMGTCVVVGAAPPGSQSPLDPSQLLSGRGIRGTTAGDSNPRLFIPRLLRLWRAGRLPIEKLAALYDFTDIDRAVGDMSSGGVLKPILTM